MNMFWALVVAWCVFDPVSARYAGRIEELREKNKDLLKLAGVADLQSYPQQVKRIIDLADSEAGTVLGPYRRFLCAVVAGNPATFDTMGTTALDNDIAPQVTRCQYDPETKTYTVDFIYVDITGRKNECKGANQELYVDPDHLATFTNEDPRCGPLSA